MENIEPRVFRQRLILEGHYSAHLTEESIRTYLNDLSLVLDMRIFAGPFSWPPDDRSHPEVPLNDLNGFVAWTESGCHVYAWRSCRFFTCDIYSCKKFSPEKVIEFTARFLSSQDMVHLSL
jgi:S-adenosylmethionine decarboxylase